MAQHHVAKLTPDERRRLVELVRRGRGRRRNLTGSERDELATLIEKAEGWTFVGSAVAKLSPLPIPRRVVKAIIER